MPFGTAGYEPVELPHIDRSLLTDDCELATLYAAIMHVVGTPNLMRASLPILRTILEQPRDYSNLLEHVRDCAAQRHYTVQADWNATQLCENLWDEIGKEVEISGRWHETFLSVMTDALRSCPDSDRVYFR